MGDTNGIVRILSCVYNDKLSRFACASSVFTLSQVDNIVNLQFNSFNIFRKIPSQIGSPVSVSLVARGYRQSVPVSICRYNQVP